MARDENCSVEESSSCDDHLHDGFKIRFFNLVLVDAQILADQRHEVFDDEYLGLESFASIGETSHENSLNLLGVAVLG